VNIKSIITFENVYKVYEKGGSKINALTDVSFSLEPGTLSTIHGPSGSGKTTLIYLMGLLKKPNTGEIIIKGIKTSNLDEKKRCKLIRDEIGFIFRRSNLLPNLTALENVMLPMSSSDNKKAEKLLEKVEVSDWNRFPINLSFEEEQKVALARSLVNNPTFILADEPTADLDSKTAQNFMNLLKKLDNVTILITSDDNLLGEFNKFSNQNFKLKDGVLTG